MFLYVFRAVAHVTITTAKKYVFEICDVKTWRFYKKPIGSLKSTFATQNIWKFTKFNKPFWLLKSPVADPEEGGGHPDSEIGGGVVSKKNFFRPFGHQFGQKIWGGGGRPPWIRHWSRSMLRNPRQSWFLDFTLWILDPRFFVSGACICIQLFSGIFFFELYSGFQSPGFWIPDSTSKNFPDSPVQARSFRGENLTTNSRLQA